MRQHIHLVFRSYLPVITENQDMLPVKEQVRVFNQPSTPCLDPEGNLLIPDKMNHCIRKITPEGEVTLYAGQPQTSGHTDGLPDKAKFYEPEAVTFSGNALIVADRGNHCVRNVVIE